MIRSDCGYDGNFCYFSCGLCQGESLVAALEDELSDRLGCKFSRLNIHLYVQRSSGYIK